MNFGNLLAVLNACVSLGKMSTFGTGMRFARDQLCVRINLGLNRESRIQLRDDTKIQFRRNRGDMQSLREVWLDRHYRLPDYVRGRTSLVDLGGNIGLTSLWLAKQYGFSNIVIVEPDEGNAQQIASNLSENGIQATIIRAAVGPSDGVIKFSSTGSSNVGRISDSGKEVQMVSMKTVMDRLGGRKVDLVKLDIEGGEEFLVSANCEWMELVDFVITELHPEVIDLENVIRAFKRHGLSYRPGNAGGQRSCHANYMDMFVRESAC